MAAKEKWISFAGFIRIVARIEQQSTVRKKMATGTFAYNALRTKTLKERIKT